MEFELDAEHNLLSLLDEINSFSYTIGSSSVFIIDEPVKREVFAASFRDRIVHHLLINIVGECIEKRFIYDSYACREGKGTHQGINRLKRAMAANPDGWVLKMDIRSFFMNINIDLLWRRLSTYLKDNLFDARLDSILYLTYLIIFNDPTKDCIFLCPKSKWDDLPQDKNLFHAKKN